MWSALKSDLLDFVTTIQSDTTNTLSKVLGEDVEEEVEEESVLDKLKATVRRTYETYAKPLKENKAREYERFKKKFNLTSYGKDIAVVLDEEPEVSRFYAELVPLSISPEEFWARLFFRLHLLNRSGSASFEDDDEEEEELVWEGDEDNQGNNQDELCSPATQQAKANQEEVSHLHKRIQELEEENGRLKGQVKTLVSRISQLETELSKSKDLPVAPTSTPSPESPQPVAPILPPALSSPASSSVVEEDSKPRATAISPSNSTISEGSGVIVSHSNHSLEEEPLPQHKPLPNTSKSSPTKEASSSNISQQTTKYLAALDDEEEDEWG